MATKSDTDGAIFFTTIFFSEYMREAHHILAVSPTRESHSCA